MTPKPKCFSRPFPPSPLLWIYTRPSGKLSTLSYYISLLVSVPEDSFLLCFVVVVGTSRSFLQLNHTYHASIITP